jgi:hypothetical protein
MALVARISRAYRICFFSAIQYDGRFKPVSRALKREKSHFYRFFEKKTNFFQKKWIFCLLCDTFIYRGSCVRMMNKHAPLLGILFISFILIACGDLGWDMVISSAGTYQVSASVNEVSLDTCAIVGQDSDIHPYFKNSLVNDPDVRGLVVFLQNSQGEQVSGEFHYSLLSESEDTVESGEKDIPESGEAGDPSIAVPADEVPTAQVPADEVLAVEFPVEHIQVSRLDQQLPAFILPENLAIGYYTIVFHVLGQKDVLYQTSKSIYYIADAEFELTDLQSYLPSALAGAHLASPGENVLLEALISADERLTPYVIWYSGKQSIAEGYVSDGAGRLMWQVPDQPLFHTIRVEVFPIMPENRLRRSITGKTKELLLPVSTKNERKKGPAGGEETFTHWYDFAGTLQDVQNPGEPNALIPLELTAPAWMPHGGMYGLSINPGDQYGLPVSFTPLNQGEYGRGRVKLHFAPLGVGTILDLRLNQRDSSDVLQVNVSLTESGLILSIELEKNRYEKTLELPDRENYISVIFDYEFTNNNFKAGLSLNNTAVFLEPDLSELSSFITGLGTLQLGSVFSMPVVKTDMVNSDESPSDDTTLEETKGVTPTAVMVELRTAYDITTTTRWEMAQEPEENIIAAVPGNERDRRAGIDTTLNVVN